MAGQYTYRMDVRLSKNYNSVGVSVEYGRDAKPGENRDALVKDVEAFVHERLEVGIQEADSLLNDKGKKSW